MGCFNHTANISKLPISCGNRIVVLVGIVRNSNTEDLDNFAPGLGFTPIAYPIRGEYNDYGSIENVDRTAVVEDLEKFFDMEIDKIVDVAERISSGCRHQVEEDADAIEEKISSAVAAQSYYHGLKKDKNNWRFGYFMEHEDVFDKLVSMYNVSWADHYEWRIPHSFFEELGYTKTNHGKENSYELNTWTHETLPELEENCYFYKKEHYKNYDHVHNTIGKMCKYIGVDVPEKYNQSFFGAMFDLDVKELEAYNTPMDEATKKMLWKYELAKNRCTFIDAPFSSRNSFYNGYGEGLASIGTLLCTYDYKNNEHIKKEYKKEVVDFMSFISAMRNLCITWGITCYHNQEINYDAHNEFAKFCSDFIAEKTKEYNAEWDEEYEEGEE